MLCFVLILAGLSLNHSPFFTHVGKIVWFCSGVSEVTLKHMGKPTRTKPQNITRSVRIMLGILFNIFSRVCFTATRGDVTWHGNAFRITGPLLRGESDGHTWIPLSNAKIWCFYLSTCVFAVCVNVLLNKVAGDCGVTAPRDANGVRIVAPVMWWNITVIINIAVVIISHSMNVTSSKDHH